MIIIIIMIIAILIIMPCDMSFLELEERARAPVALSSRACRC